MKAAASHMVSAGATTAGLTLGQLKVNEKANEIKVVHELLELPKLETFSDRMES
jgi:hypothetical protein